MSGVLTNQQKSGEYYRIAYKCAETKQTTGCNGNCAMCVLNVHLYVDDPREATLIKTSAAMDYGKYVTVLQSVQATKTRGAIATLISAAIAALIFVGLPTACVMRSCAHKPSAPTYEQYSVDNKNEAIQSAVMYSINSKRDVNNDGIISCIDYAVLFKEYMPEARLIWNYNSVTKWSHIFIQIYGIKVEPTCIIYGVENKRIDKYWGRDYNSFYDKDVTPYYGQIKNGTMQWFWELY